MQTRIKFFGLIALALAFVANCAFAYQPPIGIPAPVWGTLNPITTPAPAAPAAWPNTVTAGDYYIDPDSPNATDVNNTYGFPEKPRKTIDENTTYPPGTYMEVHGHFSTGVTLKFDCTEARPCWLRGASQATAPVWSARINLANCKFLFVENFDSNGGIGGGFAVTGMKANNVVIRHSKIRNKTWTGNTSGIGINPDRGGGVIHDIVVYDDQFSALGDWQETQDQDFHGVNPNLWGRGKYPATEEYNIWVLNSSFYRIGGNAVQVNAATTGPCTKHFDCSFGAHLHNIYVGFNTESEGREAGFWSKQASDVIFSQNVAHNNRKEGGQPGDCGGYQYGPDNLWFIYNTFYDCNNGIRQSDTSATVSGPTSGSVYIIGNLIYDIHTEPGLESKYSDPSDFWRYGQGINLWQGNKNRYIVDNTIYDVDGGINVFQKGPTVIQGNIIADTKNTDQFISTGNAYENITILRNIFYNASGDYGFRWHYRRYDSLSAFQSASGQCDGCIIANPEFKNPTSDPATADFTLKPGSPAIESNVQPKQTVDVYQRFQDLYGLDIRKDRLGTPRPSGPNKDMGAFEYPAPTSSPNAPLPASLITQ